MDLTPYINGGLGVAAFAALMWLVRELVAGQIRKDISTLKEHAVKSDGRLEKLEEQGEYVREHLADDIAEAIQRKPLRIEMATPAHGLPALRVGEDSPRANGPSSLRNLG